MAGLSLKLGLVKHQVMRLELKLKLTPPVSASVEEARLKLPTHLTREISDEVISLVSDYVAKEQPTKPYTDNQILNYLHEQGYPDLKRCDIAYARLELGILSSSKRKEGYSS